MSSKNDQSKKPANHDRWVLSEAVGCSGGNPKCGCRERYEKRCAKCGCRERYVERCAKCGQIIRSRCAKCGQIVPGSERYCGCRDQPRR